MNICRAFLFNFLGLLPGLALVSCTSKTTEPPPPAADSLATEKPRIGGPFENSELFYAGMPDEIPSVSQSPAWGEPGQKLLVTGTVYRSDGKTPAPGIVIYLYHTDTRGLYSCHDTSDAGQRRHGYIRAWVKTDEAGRYSLFTVRPAPYPDNSLPAHIHPAVLEPGLNEYYIDDVVFTDDALVNETYHSREEKRGGSGIITPVIKGDLQIVKRDIVLGMNIPGYPGGR